MPTWACWLLAANVCCLVACACGVAWLDGAFDLLTNAFRRGAKSRPAEVDAAEHAAARAARIDELERELGIGPYAPDQRQWTWDEAQRATPAELAAAICRGQLADLGFHPGKRSS